MKYIKHFVFGFSLVFSLFLSVVLFQRYKVGQIRIHLTPHQKSLPPIAIAREDRCAEIALLLFGLIRHNTTVDNPPVTTSFEKNLRTPLEEWFGADHVHTYLHTFEVFTDIHNGRNGEHSTLPKPDVSVFKPEKSMVEIQEGVDITLENLFNRTVEVGDAYSNGNGTSVLNMLRAYWSLQKSWELSERALAGLKFVSVGKNQSSSCLPVKYDKLGGKSFDLYVIARLDTVFLEELDFKKTNTVDFDIITPNWGHYPFQGLKGLNDRFAIANSKAAMIYSHRLKLAEEFAQSKRILHAETALLHAIRRENLKIGFINSTFGLIRARAGEKVHNHDLEIFCGKDWNGYTGMCKLIVEHL